MLVAVTAKSEIAQCQSKLEHALKAKLTAHERLRIGHRGGSFVEMVFHGPGLWYSTSREDDVEIARYWNGFGQGKRDRGDQVIAVEINAPLKGYEARVSGLFARDDRSNQHVLLHRGRVGGGGRGIGKTAFRDWSRNAWVEVVGPDNVRDEAILVARLASGNVVDQIRAFVEEVAAFKTEARAGKLTRRPSSPDATKTFNPEFHGKKKGHRAGTLEYESFHGLVVNTLAKKITADHGGKDCRVFNTSQIDLAVEINEKLHHLYEVKSSGDLHSIYTGTGQLMLHSLLGTGVAKTLVLPKGELSNNMRKLLPHLHIKVLEFQIKSGKVTFPS